MAPFRPAIASMSLGRGNIHKLPQKLDQAKRFGFKGIEIHIEDVDFIAEVMEGGITFRNQLESATQIRKMHDDRGLSIVCLQPFMHYEGLRDGKQHSKRIEKLQEWLQLVKILGTDIVSIPSSFLSEQEITDDMDVIVQDFREIAEMGSKESPAIRFAYESLSWGTYINTWEDCWEVVRRVDRWNFGICLDTYNIAARVYADPSLSSGKTPNAETAMADSILRLVRTVDVGKVFYVQVVDGERLQTPLIKGHEFHVEGQPARMNWSRNCRLFYGEKEHGAYLPVKAIAEAIFIRLGFEGWVSMELFNRIMSSTDKDIPEQLVRRGASSWKKLVKELDLTVELR